VFGVWGGAAGGAGLAGLVEGTPWRLVAGVPAVGFLGIGTGCGAGLPDWGVVGDLSAGSAQGDQPGSKVSAGRNWGAGRGTGNGIAPQGKAPPDGS
jgi:hypothetical protein